MWKKRAIAAALDIGRVAAKSVIIGWMASWAIGSGLEYGARSFIIQAQRELEVREQKQRPPTPVRVMAPDEA